MAAVLMAYLIARDDANAADAVWDAARAGFEADACGAASWETLATFRRVRSVFETRYRPLRGY